MNSNNLSTFENIYGLSHELIDEIVSSFNLDFPNNLNKLITYFSHQNWLMRRAASDFCVKIGNQILKPLYEVLKNVNISDDTLYWGVKTYTKFNETSYSNEACDYLIKLLEYFTSNYNLSTHNKLVYIIRGCLIFKPINYISLFISLLGHSNWLIRKEAAEVIIKIGRPAAIHLRNAFTSGNKDIRYWTVKLLGKVLGDEAIDAFKKILKSEKKDLRYYALTALGENDNEEVLSLIISCLSDESWLVRAQAAEILERKGKKVINLLKKAFNNESNSDVKYWAIKVLAKLLKDEAIEDLKNVLTSDDSELKYCVIEAFSTMDFKKVAPILLKCFDDTVWLVRKHAATAFLKFGVEACDYLFKVLETETNENIRYWAIYVISNTKNAPIDRFNKLLKESKPNERIFIIQALKEFKNVEVLSILFELLTDKSWPIRREAAYAICEYDVNTVINELIKRLDLLDKNADFKFWTYKILNILDRSAIEVISNLISEAQLVCDELKLVKLFQLFELFNSPLILDIILQILKGKKQNYKELLLNCFHDIQNEKFIQNLLSCLEFEDAGTCYYIALILKNISKNSYHLLYSSLNDKNIEKNIWICKIFSEIKDPVFISPLIILLSSKNKTLKLEAIKTLIKFDLKLVFSELIKKISDFEEEERLFVIENIKNIINDEILEFLVDQFDDISDVTAYWIAKLLVESKNINLRKLENMKKLNVESKKHYWIKKILDHIKGISFI